jgi:cell division initiation protein
MKITPLEIRQKAFEKVLRGYDKDEVNAFLQTLSQEWERLMDENKEVRIKQEATEREVAKLREVESSLYRTLKTAEDTGANVIGQANKTAELILRENQMRADSILNEAKMKSKNTIEEAEMISNDRVERAKTAARDFDPDQHVAWAKRESKKALFPNAEIESEIKSSLPSPVQPEPVKQVLMEVPHSQRSFFDDIQ